MYLPSSMGTIPFRVIRAMQRRGHRSAAVERDRHCAERRVPCLGLAPVRLGSWPGTSARPNARYLASDR